MTSLLLLGFMLGIRHALEADHLATVATITSQSNTAKQMLRQGLAWGIGHSITIMLLAGTVLWMDSLISEDVAITLETLVGLMMLILGFGVVHKALRSHFHIHAHQHSDGKHHIHFHCHTKKQFENHHAPNAHEHKHIANLPLKGLFLGLIHGLAGSAALLLLFVGEIESVAQGFAYLSLFSIGSIAGMLLFSLAISVPLTFTARKLVRTHQALQFSIGLVTFGIGGFILWEGVFSGVFLSYL